MPSKHVKSSSLLAIREIRIKATTCVTPTRMAMMKRQLLVKMWKTCFLR